YQLRREHLYRAVPGGSAVRGFQPRLRDLRIRAPGVARLGDRPIAGQVQRYGRPSLAAGCRELHRNRRRRRPGDWLRRAYRGGAIERRDTDGLPRTRADAAWTPAAGQLAFYVLCPGPR